MRTMVSWTLTLAVGAWTGPPLAAQCASRQEAASNLTQRAVDPVDPAAAAKAGEEMNQILTEWEKRNKDIRSLDISFTKIHRSQAFGDEHFRGRAMLHGRDLKYIEFTNVKISADRKPLDHVEPESSERIVVTGKEMVQYLWDEKRIIVFPLDSWLARMTLDPDVGLPFLLNMNPTAAKERFSMTLLKQDARQYLIKIVPNKEADKKAFRQVFLWLNKQTYLADQLWVYPDEPKDRVEYHFIGGNNSISLNVELDENFFKYLVIPGWKIVKNPAPFKWFK